MDTAETMVTLELEPVAETLEESLPMVPEKTEVWPAGYGLLILLMMRLKVYTRTLLKMLFNVMTLPKREQVLPA